MTIKGSCLCGGVVFTIDKIEPLIGHCHCSMCQKFHGAAFSTFAEVQLKNIHWQQGEELLQSYIAVNNTQRQFCRVCGSSLTFKSAFNTHSIEVALACLDVKVDVSPNAHIYCESKVAWFDLNDNLPKYLRYRDEDPL